jgi:hypothetical protein
MTWRTFIRAHWPALLAADFFTTKLRTLRGLRTYYTAFVIELPSRHVQILGSTPYPDGAFVVQAFRSLMSEAEVLRAGRVGAATVSAAAHSVESRCAMVGACVARLMALAVQRPYVPE